jgi:hypothetical protein|eukprot:COSAG02_NODE_6366_length_3622_cov_2.234175_4_plen_62_part_00
MSGAFKSPVFSDVTAAAVRLAATRSIHRTPLLESVALNLLTGARVRCIPTTYPLTNRTRAH